MAKFKLMKQKWFPRPHDQEHSWFHGLETAAVNRATIYPIVHYDEGLLAPDTYFSNPEHASFGETSEPNCFVGSRVDKIFSELQLYLTKGALETDKIHALRLAIMPIMMAFKENYIAADEKSTLAVEDVLEVQTETTDRQGGPLYNDVKMVERFSNSALMHSRVPFLTTTQVLEGVAFSPQTLYDSMHYFTIAGKVRASHGGLKWLTLTRNRPYIKIRTKLASKTKAMNPFTFFGLMVYVPEVGSQYQIPVAGDTTNISHVGCIIHNRYNEWNQGFDMEKV